MKSYLKVTVIIFLCSILITACNEKDIEYQELGFNDLDVEIVDREYEDEYTVELSDDLKMLQDEMVKIEGFISPISPMGSDFFYLVETSTGGCPFCANPEISYDDIVQIYFPDDSDLIYTSSKIEVIGIFNPGFETDKYGHRSFLRIEGEKINEFE